MLLLASGPGALAATGHPQLDLGIARFALATGDDAIALRHTRDPQTEHQRLVRAKALLNSGSRRQALALLDRLIDGDYYRGEAALLKSALITDDPSARDALLELAAAKGHGEVRQQARYRLAEAARVNERPEQAGQMLATMDPGYWAALGYMNMAADYGRRDLNPARALIALRVALAMAEADPERRRGEALKAELLLRAGLLAYQDDDYDKAIGFLEKVSLESYRTPQALYLHGLALSAKGNQRDALQSWHRARKYPLAFAGVAESWLGTGRGYDLAGYLGQAGEAYLAASAGYESERVTLGKLAEQIRQQGAFDALLAGAGEAQTAWFLADNRLLTQPRSAYLLRFMENVESQQAVTRVRELRGLLGQMAQQQSTLKVFQNTLEQRLADSPTGNAVQPAGFDRELESLSRRIAAARQDAVAGSDPAEQLSQLALTLSDLTASADRFAARLGSRDQRLRTLLTQISDALARLEQNRHRASGALATASAELDRRLLAYVDAETVRMTGALEKAEQQIAHLYEYLALQNLSRRTP